MPNCRVLVCQSSACNNNGAGHLVRDIEELVMGQAEIEETLCLGHCKFGPNADVMLGPTTRKVLQGLNNFKKVLDLVEKDAGLQVSKQTKKVAPIKYEARRETDPVKRGKVLSKAFAALGPESTADPISLASLLVLRSGTHLPKDKQSALQDAQKAVDVLPNWAQARIALATVYEAMEHWTEAASQLDTALEIGSCIKLGAVSRQLTRVQKHLPPPEQQDLQTPQPRVLDSDLSSVTESSIAPSDTNFSLASFNTRTSDTESSTTSGLGSVDNHLFTSKEAQTSSGPSRPKGKSRARAHRRERSKSEKRAKRKEAPKDVIPEEAPAPTVPEPIALASVAETHDNLNPSATTQFRRVISLSPEQYWVLQRVTQLNHDTVLLDLRIQDMAMLSPVPTSILWHVDILREVGLGEGEEISRSYTPVSSAQEYSEGILRLMIKVYHRGVMTTYLASLRPESLVLVSPPVHTAELDGSKGTLLIVGGSSVVVALQAAKELLDRFPTQRVTVLCCNSSQRDALYLEDFEEIAKRHRLFRIVHCISDGVLPTCFNPQVTWKSGRISIEDVRSHSAALTQCIVSGPGGLCAAARRMWDVIGRPPDRLAVLDDVEPPNSGLFLPESKGLTARHVDTVVISV